MHLNENLKRAFFRKPFIFTMLLSLAIAAWQAYAVRIWMPRVPSEAVMMSFGPGSAWLGLVHEGGTIVLLLIYPLLASLSYGDMITEEKQTGVQQLILTRMERGKYYRLHFLTGFLIGGISGIAALLFHLMMVLAFVPMVSISPIFSSALISEGYMFAQLYFQNLPLYFILRLMVLFLWSGTLAGLSLALSLWIRQRYIALIIPFLILLLYDLTLGSKLGQIGAAVIFGERLTPATLMVFIGVFFSALLLYMWGARRERDVLSIS